MCDGGTDGVGPVVSPETSATPPVVTPIDPVTARLTELGVDSKYFAKIKSLGIETVTDLVFLSEADLVADPDKMPVIQARKLIKAVVPVATSAVTAPVSASPRNTMVAASNVRLAEPPASTAGWLSDLCAIKPQIIAPITVVTGVKAAMADAWGYFQLPRRMMRMLRRAADDIGEGVPDLYFELQNLTAARRYGALVAWMQGRGAACTVGERNRFLTKVQTKLWDAIDAFYMELETWRKGRRESQDPSEAMANAFAGELQIYDATPVRTAVLALGSNINFTFSGTGVYAATALALDREKLQEVLKTLDFRLFGVQSREKLLADLECAVPPEMLAAEATIGKFLWNAMALKDMAAGGYDEQKFLIELASIGTSRPWNAVKTAMGKRKPTNGGREHLSGTGGGRATVDADEDELFEDHDDDLEGFDETDPKPRRR